VGDATEDAPDKRALALPFRPLSFSGHSDFAAERISPPIYSLAIGRAGRVPSTFTPAGIAYGQPGQAERCRLR